MTPAEFRAEMRHKAQVAIEQGDFFFPCSLHQAQFLAALWYNAFTGRTKTRKDAYRHCLAWLWSENSAHNLRTVEANITIDWLLGGQPRRAGFPMPCAEAVAMSAAILQEGEGT